MTARTQTHLRTLPDELGSAIVAGGGRVHGRRQQEFESALTGWAGADLDHGAGFFVLVGPPGLAEPAAREFTLAASEALGRVMPQSFDTEFVREVKDRGRNIEQDSSARYSDTRFGGNMHTDGMHRAGHVPDYFALYCVRQASRGGELLLVDVAELYRRLEGRPDLLAALRGGFFFDTRTADPALPQAIRRPVLDDYRGGTRVHYFREYIESGQRKSGAGPFTAAQVEALDFVDSVIGDPGLQQRVRAEAGQMLFINNTRLIHGRTDFTDPDGPAGGRLLYRTWIDSSSRRSGRTNG